MFGSVGQGLLRWPISIAVFAGISGRDFDVGFEKVGVECDRLGEQVSGLEIVFLGVMGHQEA
jgi:hypothetical protein